MFNGHCDLNLLTSPSMHRHGLQIEISISLPAFLQARVEAIIVSSALINISRVSTKKSVEDCNYQTSILNGDL